MRKSLGKYILPILLSAAVMLASCGQDVGETSLGSSTSSTAGTTTASAVTDISGTTAANVTATETTTATTVATTPAATTTTAAPPPVVEEITEPYCRAAMLYCVEDDRVLYSKAEDEQISLASITKLLTASVALKYLSPETVVTVGTEIGLVKPESTMAYLPYGTKIKLYDLLGAMLLPSGNDAAYTVAVSAARAMTAGGDFSDSEAVDFFVGLMNGFAEELGMTNSHFANPEGWDDSGHYTTMNDLIKLVKYAWSLSEIREITGERQKLHYYPEGGYALWENTNQLLNGGSGYYNPDCRGIKTGTTASAGCCLVSAFDRNGKTYLCAVMGCNEDGDRYILTNKIIEAYT